MEPDAPRPRIARVWARNFRSIESLDLELGDLTVLVGRNGAGKSNTVGVLRFMRNCELHGFDKAVRDEGGTGALRTSGTDYVELGIEVEGGVGKGQYVVSLTPGGARARREKASVWPTGYQDETSIRTGFRETGSWTTREDPLGRPILHDLVPHAEAKVQEGALGRDRVEGIRNVTAMMVEAIRSMSFYDFLPSFHREPQRPGFPPLEDIGANLTSVLRDALAGPDHRTIRQSLRLLIDGASDIDVRDLGSHLVAEVVYGTSGDGEPQHFDLGLESDGTIRLIAILAALYQSPPRTLVVIEEPERIIHPGALAVLAGVLK